jgi:Fe-S-cluster-containing dehydrogenase component
VSQLGFVLDLDRCTGCAACVLACSTENGLSSGIAWRSIVTFNQSRFPTAPVLQYSLACNHCLEPACLAGCPAAAYSKDPTTGAVDLDPERCMGCRYCAWVCPYEAPRFAAGHGVMEKCTFCGHRLAKGLEPACVAACPVEALGLEETSEPGVVVRAGFPETGLRPAIRIVGSRRQAPPVMTGAPHTVPPSAPMSSLRWDTLRVEWSLWIFSSVMALLVAWFAAAAAGGVRFVPLQFGAAGALALGVSALHLSRPARAWRGPLNWRRSWISREAVLVVLFLGAGSAVGFTGSTGPAVVWPVAAVGFTALFAMDMVYRVRGQTSPALPHSAMATATAALYLGLLLASPALAIPAAALKLALYLLRRRRATGPAGIGLDAVRLAALVLPCLLLFRGGTPAWLLLALAVPGELLDRAEFYAGLEFLTPTLQVRRDLSSRNRSNVQRSNV